MRMRIRHWLHWALVYCLGTVAAGPALASDAPAHRIVSLAPHITELLFAAGAGDSIVGALEYSNYPPAAKNITRVGDNRALDLERIVALKPDLIVAWPHGYGAGQLDALRQLGLRVEVSDPRRFADIARDIERLGELAGTSAPAKAAAERLRARVRELEG